MKKGLLFVLLASLVAFPSMVWAQESYGYNPGDWEFTLNGSGSADEDFDDTLFSVEGSLAKFLTPGWEVGLRQGIGFADREGSDNDWNGSTRLFTDYNFDLNRLKPFVGVNAGYLYGDGVNDTWIAGPEAGLKFFVSPDAFVYGSAEYNYLLDEGDDDDLFEDARTVYSVGLGIRF